MAALVIGGSGRGAGKTAVGCALIAALPEFRWVGVKISPHSHEAGEVWAEGNPNSEKDTGRYLRAGAEQAYLISGQAHQADQADLAGPYGEAGKTMLAGLPLGLNGLSLLVESNRFEPGLSAWADEPVVSLAILAGPVAAWKSSLWERVGSVDALVLTSSLEIEDLPIELRDNLVFRLSDGFWISPDLVTFVRRKLLGDLV